MSTNLAPYAMDPQRSRGRLHRGYTYSFMNEFQQDLIRITNCASFRRLEYKTQVFINGKGDHYRTRLTHSLEVAQIGRIVANALDISSDLTEILCLSHDLGHPPFGHAGEEVLNRMLKDHGGFNHNVYVLKLLTELEEKYINFNGLNLTWETLEGITKHNGPLKGKHSTIKYKHDYIIEYSNKHDLALDKFPSLEAQTASLADDIAYNCHDLEDGLKAKLFSLEDLYKANIFNDIIDEVRSLKVKVEMRRIIHEIIEKLSIRLTEDLIRNSRANIKRLKIKSFQDVQDAEEGVIGFSRPCQTIINKLKKFLLKHMYRNSEVLKMTSKGAKIVEDLYNLYMNNPQSLPQKWYQKISKNQKNLPLIIEHYIAGMTDPFAVNAHKFFL